MTFCPSIALRNPHLQTFLATLDWRARWIERKSSGLRGVSRRLILECGDGTLLAAEHAAPIDPQACRGTVTLFHGWEGCADSAYVVSVGRCLRRCGYEIYRVNFRDHGDTHHLNPGMFHSCRLEEMVLAVEEIARRSPAGPHFLVGFSLGGNFALRIACEAPARGVALQHVVAICPVIDPANVLAAIEAAPRFYQDRFVRRWESSLRKKERAFPELYRVDPLGPPTLRHRIETLVRRFSEFADAAEYFEGYSVAKDRLARLRCPSTIIAAEDDPVIPIDDIRGIRGSRTLAIEIQRWGGHCGFIENLRLQSWVERRIPQILE